jgi:UrcA family protein
MIRTLAFAALAVAFAGQAAAEETAAPTQTVAYRAGDLDTAAGAKAVQQRVERVARNLCRADMPGSTERQANEASCRRESVSVAMRSVDQTRVASANANTNSQSRGAGL